jgi:hypothetical protein
MIRSGDGSITTAKTMEIPWAGTPRIDKRRGSALPRDLGRIDPERGAAPIYVCVQVDQPRHDQKPTRIDDLGPSVGKIAADRFDPAIGESDIGRLVAFACRIYDATAPQDQIRHGLKALSVMTASHRPQPILMRNMVQQAWPEADNADHDQVNCDHVIQEARHKKNEYTGDERGQRLDHDNIEGHEAESLFRATIRPGTAEVHMEEIFTGGCLCGAVRYRITAAPVEALYCHCRMCQRAHGAPVIAWITVALDSFAVTAGRPTAYPSSAKASRHFCGRCGTPLTWRATDNPRLVDISIATLDNPEAVEPALHLWTESQISWFEIADHLPRYPTNERPKAML